MLGRNHRHSSSQRPESVQGIVVVVVVVAHVIYACTAACEIAARHDDVIADTQQSQYLHQHHTITAQQYHYTWPYISREE